MSKFCTTCGAALDDNATFCTNCGTPQQAQQAAPSQGAAPAQANAAGGTPATAAASAVKDKLASVDMSGFKTALSKENIASLKTNPNKYTIITLCAIGVVCLALIIILLVVLLGGGYKKPVKNMIKALETGDGEYMVKVLAECEADAKEERYVDDGDYDSLEEYYEETLEKKLEKLEDEYGDDISISFSVYEKDELTEKQLKSYKSYYKSDFDKKVDVSAGYNLLLEMEWEGDDDEEAGLAAVTVLKVDGDWVIYSPSLNDIIPTTVGGSAFAGDEDEIDDMKDQYKKMKKAADKLKDLDDIDDLDDLGDVLGDLDLGDFM
ncbi:MAG: zinc ribbon domain-containing protein [Ruminococcus sp.]|nr:zinc ribbon domain-containing protein [Ruminococcus sp.]